MSESWQRFTFSNLQGDAVTFALGKNKPVKVHLSWAMWSPRLCSAVGLARRCRGQSPAGPAWPGRQRQRKWPFSPLPPDVLASLSHFSHQTGYLQESLPRVCFLSPSRSLFLIFSRPARGGEEVEERRNTEKVSWSGCERDREEQQLTQLQQTIFSPDVGVLNPAATLCALCEPTSLTSGLLSCAARVWGNIQ